MRILFEKHSIGENANEQSCCSSNQYHLDLEIQRALAVNEEKVCCLLDNRIEKNLYCV